MTLGADSMMLTSASQMSRFNLEGSRFDFGIDEEGMEGDITKSVNAMVNEGLVSKFTRKMNEPGHGPGHGRHAHGHASGQKNFGGRRSIVVSMGAATESIKERQVGGPCTLLHIFPLQNTNLYQNVT